MMIITLSRRNLLTLLHKLEVTGSARTIIIPTGIRVTAIPDEEHYGDRLPGPVYPDTEDFIIDYEAFLAMRSRP